MDSVDQPPYKFFSKKQINSKFHKILQLCQGNTDHQDIIKIIDKTFYNRVILGIPLDSDFSEFYLYRVTKIYENINDKDSSAFSYPPKPIMGRANIKDFPVFYCSINPATALKEIRAATFLGEIVYVSEWKVKFHNEVYAHPLFINSKTMKMKGYTAKVAKNMISLSNSILNPLPNHLKNSIRQLLLRVGDLFTLAGSEKYNVTSAYAHDILYSEKGLNIPIIIYPSVETEHAGINFAIHPRFMKTDMINLNRVLKVKISASHKKDVSVQVITKGIANSDRSVTWYKGNLVIKLIAYSECSIRTDNGIVLSGNLALSTQINNSDYTIQMYLKDVINSYFIPNISFNSFDEDHFNIKSVENQKTVHFVCNPGSSILTSKGYSDIKVMSVPAKWIEEYILL